ncbi:response regulator [Methylocystis bryophila]|uniref:response regulator n=1 Tax=Methylocystis bryophila TaxID=655015 RepID=UPI00249236FA|nr:response regulator [Methylocystis bryophila]
MPVIMVGMSDKEARGDVNVARVLVIDDEHDVADTFAMLLQTFGVKVCKAYDGLSGVAAIDVFGPDLIFLDIGMPGLDGYETARRIRSDRHRRPFTLVALTGWGRKEDCRRAQEAGFDLQLTKPVSLEVLEDLLERVRSDGAAAPPRAG